MDKDGLCTLARSIVEAGEPLPAPLALALIECVERTLPSPAIANRNLRWRLKVDNRRKETGWSELKACEELAKHVDYGDDDGDAIRTAINRSRRQQKAIWRTLAAVFEYHALGTCEMFQDIRD